ncbi:hypothetical protein J6590_014370 [Homalodisca vitripennis]|nr:hypothetical protein J6590_014370 [Homalodisca vitripennis]
MDLPPGTSGIQNRRQFVANSDSDYEDDPGVPGYAPDLDDEQYETDESEVEDPDYDMMLVNAHYLYNEVRTSSGENKMPLYDFRLEVIDKLLPDVPEPPRPLKRRRVPHVPSRITEKVACGKRSKQKRCSVCYANGRKKYVMWQCLECDGQPGLCVPHCFDQFHD